MPAVGDEALAAHASFSESDVQRVVAACSQGAVDRDQILHAADFRRQHDRIVRLSEFLGTGRTLQRGFDHRGAHHLVGAERLG